ncbi:hypothetical protein FA10DRAFT_303339 [Acaromyces ingoldii]|uniref:Uncharacterized protein n=1 Tax=Acaromyces ingoldii TaxID=215250 RepID=A0A316YIB4_9BASI|nr:hypothetical protein FA10DRAFT_303339 [Acaromyces ingoldii]PWN88368.1 hypothetical protein FA10DRAFT_303339 [Acaromyces ingoldii]
MAEQPPAQNAAGAPEDALDKGVDAALKKTGHGQSRNVVEKISDGVRTAFKKISGKDVPVKDT